MHNETCVFSQMSLLVVDERRRNLRAGLDALASHLGNRTAPKWPLVRCTATARNDLKTYRIGQAQDSERI